jgi:hypothetical protein
MTGSASDGRRRDACRAQSTALNPDPFDAANSAVFIGGKEIRIETLL